jgi:hypothetical protein
MHKPEDFKENMMVKLLPGFCGENTGKVLNTSTITSLRGNGAVEGFPGWYSYRTVLEACQKNPKYFIIVELSTQVINNYEIY